MLWSKFGAVLFFIYLLAGVAVRLHEERSPAFMFRYLGTTIFGAPVGVPIEFAGRVLTGRAYHLNVNRGITAYALIFLSAAVIYVIGTLLASLFVYIRRESI